MHVISFYSHINTIRQNYSDKHAVYIVNRYVTCKEKMYQLWTIMHIFKNAELLKIERLSLKILLVRVEQN